MGIKKLTVKTAVIVILTLIMSGSFSFAETGPLYLKVGLSFGSGSVSTCTVKCGDGFMIGRAVPDGVEEILRFPDTRQLTVSLQSGVITARSENGEVIYTGFDAETVIYPLGGRLSYNDTVYRGGLSFFLPSGGGMNVINYVSVEEYLYGVLNSEMGYHNPIEALKAQAVTARSYASVYRERHRNDGFDICAAVHCQLYKGYSDEHSQTNRAVDETAGRTLMYDGKIVSGYYFKNSGGHTQSAEDVWGGKVPYAVGVKDEYSPVYQWSHTLTFQELRTRLEASGNNIGQIQSVTITRRNQAGAAAAVQFRGSQGTIELRGDSLRTVFGGINIRSTMFSFGEGVSAGDDFVHVMGAGGTVERKRPGDVFVISGSGAVSRMTALGQLGGDRVESVTAGPLVFTGTGYGHGVGMPQDSAIEMARRGYLYTEILKYFYTGIDIR